MGLAIPTILVTAYPDDVDRNRALTRLIARFMRPPYSPEVSWRAPFPRWAR
jgi:hypothetical protein